MHQIQSSSKFSSFIILHSLILKVQNVERAENYQQTGQWVIHYIDK